MLAYISCGVRNLAYYTIHYPLAIGLPILGPKTADCHKESPR